ncbi:MAG TPA: hypothetical protein VD962_04310, partial [Rubricoccaceae bacterium]|nr:hypothetical protein [Rubricoccaceae bacterium]
MADPHPDLLAALRTRLERGAPVALPGLGTLRQAHVPARVETRPDGSRVLLPPGQVVSFAADEPTPDALDETNAALAATARMTPDAVHAGLDALALPVREALAFTGEASLPSVGLFRRTPDGTTFEADEALASAVNRPFAGLAPVTSLSPPTAAPPGEGAASEVREAATPALPAEPPGSYEDAEVDLQELEPLALEEGAPLGGLDAPAPLPASGSAGEGDDRVAPLETAPLESTEASDEATAPDAGDIAGFGTAVASAAALEAAASALDEPEAPSAEELLTVAEPLSPAPAEDAPAFALDDPFAREEPSGAAPPVEPSVLPVEAPSWTVLPEEQAPSLGVDFVEEPAISHQEGPLGEGVLPAAGVLPDASPLIEGGAERDTETRSEQGARPASATGEEGWADLDALLAGVWTPPEAPEPDHPLGPASEPPIEDAEYSVVGAARSSEPLPPPEPEMPREPEPAFGISPEFTLGAAAAGLAAEEAAARPPAPQAFSPPVRTAPPPR